MQKSLAILIPAYNEEKTIGNILGRLAVLCRDGILPGISRCEIVVVNDGSTDNTQAVIEDFKKANPDLAVKNFCQPNGGKGLAIRKAISEADADILVVQDADLENDPEDFAIMVPYITSGEYSVVYGSRFLNHHNKHSYISFYLGGRLVSHVSNILYGLHLTDEPTCYKMFTREVAQSVSLKCTGFEFCPEFTAKVSKAGYNIQEVPIHYHPRSIEEGKKFSWKDGVEAIWTLIKYRFVK